MRSSSTRGRTDSRMWRWLSVEPASIRRPPSGCASDPRELDDAFVVSAAEAVRQRLAVPEARQQARVPDRARDEPRVGSVVGVRPGLGRSRRVHGRLVPAPPGHRDGPLAGPRQAHRPGQPVELRTQPVDRARELLDARLGDAVPRLLEPHEPSLQGAQLAQDRGLDVEPVTADLVQLETRVVQARGELLVDVRLPRGVRAHRAQGRAARHLPQRPAARCAGPRAQEVAGLGRALLGRPRPGAHRAPAGARVRGLEPAHHVRAAGPGVVPARDVVVPAARPPGRLLAVLEHPADERRGVVEIRLGPHRIAGIRGGAVADRRQLVVDEERVLRRHEVAIAGVPRGDHRLAEQHRLRHRHAEALRPVQGDVRVAALHQPRTVRCRHVPVHEMDVGVRGGTPARSPRARRDTDRR